MTQPLPDQVPASEPDTLDVIAQANDLASLDEELNQLPQKYRDVLVMSYFAQQTNQEIADQLNESKGAIDGRIRDARRLLRVRLARRGVEVGVLAVAAAYVQSSASAASPALIQKAISLGAPGLVSQELAALNAQWETEKGLVGTIRESRGKIEAPEEGTDLDALRAHQDHCQPAPGTGHAGRACAASARAVPRHPQPHLISAPS